MQIRVAFDYRCGYSYKMARYLRELRRAGEALEIEWLPFSLEQVNEEHGEGLLLWEEPQIETGSFLGLAAGRWIERTQPDAFEAYHYGAFNAMHEEERALDHDAVLGLAKEAGVDVGALREAIDSGEAARAAGHEFVRLFNGGVFGTPTIMFPEGRGLYVRLRGVWESDEHRLRVWRHITDLAGDEVVSEVQRIVPLEPETPPVIAPPPV